MKGAVGAASVVVVVAGLSAGSSLLIPLVLAVFLAVLSLPLVEWLRRHHLPRAIAVLLTVIVFLAALTGSAGLLAAAVRQLAAAAPTYTGELRQMLANLFASLRAHDVDTTYLASAVDPARLLNWLLTALSGLVTLLSVGVLVVVVAAFILFETTGLLPPPTAAPPAGWRRQVVRAVHEMQIYLRVKTAVSLATGIAAGLWVAVIGVDMAMLWGLIAFLLNYIPNLGSVAAALPPMVFALVQFGPGSALLVLGGYLAINGVFAYLVEPYLMGRRLRFSPLAVFLSVIVWGWIWGLAGALLAVPMMTTIKIALEQSDDLRWLARLLEGRPSAS